MQLSESVPPGGYRMVLALMDLAGPDCTAIVEDYTALVTNPGVPWSMTDAARQYLWGKLVQRAQRGEVMFQGVRNPIEGAVTINAAALRGSKPDYLADTLEAVGAVFHAVGVFPAIGPQPILGNDPGYLETQFQTREATPPWLGPFQSDQTASTLPVTQPPAALEAACAWMRENVTQNERWKREVAMAACMAATHATYREARSAWAALPAEVRGKRGMRK